MRLDNERESNNVEDRRGAGGGLSLGKGKLGLGGIVLALVVGYFTGINPATLLDLMSEGATPALSTQHAPAHKPPPHDEMATFISKVLADTEDTWKVIFRETNQQYRDPKLVLFTGTTQSACGVGQAAMGPFYCSLDEKVYIDLAFYQELKDRFHAPGEFAQAYVIAHEVGHHVQNLLGISEKVHAMQARAANQAQANALSVKLELQADCFAGVWGNRADRVKNIIEPGEIEQALNAATAIGDDRLQQQSRGTIRPETFTHGSSEQRVRWFKRGMASGQAAQCNTFGERNL